MRPQNLPLSHANVIPFIMDSDLWDHFIGILSVERILEFLLLSYIKYGKMIWKTNFTHSKLVCSSLLEVSKKWSSVVGLMLKWLLILSLILIYHCSFHWETKDKTKQPTLGLVTVLLLKTKCYFQFCLQETFIYYYVLYFLPLIQTSTTIKLHWIDIFIFSFSKRARYWHY